MVSFKILAGGYDSLGFIATYLFTPGETPSLELVARSRTGPNPSWLTYHPSNKSVVYVTNEDWSGPGAVQAFAVLSNGTLAPLDTIASGGNSPAHVLALKSTKQVVVTNYSSGTGKVLNTTSTGAFERAVGTSQVLTFAKPVGGESHPHQAVEYKDEVLIPDLGSDTIWRLVANNGTTGSADLFQLAGSIPQAKGSGPRHVQVYKDRLFVLHELSAELTVQKIPALYTNEASIVANVSVVPSDGPESPQWAAAEIYIPRPSRKFPIPYIYVSNRNKGAIKDPRGDSIAIFEHVFKGTKFETLKLVKHVYTGLDSVRGFEFNGDENDNEYVIAGGSEGKGGGVAVFQRVHGGRDLKLVARNDAITHRITFLWA